MKHFFDSFDRKSKSFVLIIFLLVSTHCAAKTETTAELPKDLRGISVGMSKTDARPRLEEVADFVSEDRKTGQLWQLKNDPYFRHLAIGYDKENKVRFVTGLVDAATAKQRMRFADVGDLSKAEREINEPHHRYYWKVEAADGKPAYFVNIYGADPEFLSTYSLSEVLKQSDK